MGRGYTSEEISRRRWMMKEKEWQEGGRGGEGSVLTAEDTPISCGTA